MRLKGTKLSTKDVDIAVRDEQEHQAFVNVLLGSGFSEKMDFKKKMMGDQACAPTITSVFIREDGFHADLFHDVICNRYHIHEGVINRASLHQKYGNLDVLLMSDEDIFLAKSVTERDRDLDDMYVILEKGLDVNKLLREMEIQDSLSDTIWEAFMTQKLSDLEEKFQINISWKRDVEEIAIQKMEGAFLVERLFMM